MEMHGRRSNYTLLSQVPDDHHPQPPPAKLSGPPFHESLSGDKNKGKNDRGFDWDLTEHRLIQQQSRIGTAAFPASIGLQRQSSGSSYGESSLSGEYCVPSLSMAASDPDGFGHLHDDVFKVGSGGGGESRLKAVEAGGSSSSSKSWAQQTEESYQLQLALALRLSSEATCADDPNFLDQLTEELGSRPSSLSGSAEAMSHRFWVTA